jgi:hypothetical protein
MTVKLQRLMLALILCALSIARPAAAHHTTTHSTCAPILYCLSGFCWYEVVNNQAFEGTYASCTNWSNISVSTSSECFNEKVTTLTSTSGAFIQNFSVPSDATYDLEVAIEFATIGTPSSSLDKIVLELYEGTTLRGTINIPTRGISTSCHREDRTFGTGWAGKNLQIRVSANYATVGVSYKVNSVVLFADVN